MSKIITYVAKSLITAFEKFFTHAQEVDAEKTKRWLN